MQLSPSLSLLFIFPFIFSQLSPFLIFFRSRIPAVVIFSFRLSIIILFFLISFPSHLSFFSFYSYPSAIVLLYLSIFPLCCKLFFTLSPLPHIFIPVIFFSPFFLMCIRLPFINYLVHLSGQWGGLPKSDSTRTTTNPHPFLLFPSLSHSPLPSLQRPRRSWREKYEPCGGGRAGNGKTRGYAQHGMELWEFWEGRDWVKEEEVAGVNYFSSPWFFGRGRGG